MDDQNYQINNNNDDDDEELVKNTEVSLEYSANGNYEDDDNLEQGMKNKRKILNMKRISFIRYTWVI